MYEYTKIRRKEWSIIFRNKPWPWPFSSRQGYVVPYQFFPSFLLSWDREVTRYPYLHSHGITRRRQRGCVCTRGWRRSRGDIRRTWYQDYRSLQAVPSPPFYPLRTRVLYLARKYFQTDELESIYELYVIVEIIFNNSEENI